MKFLLTPLAGLYKFGVWCRHRLFDWGVLKSRKFNTPIICIGNITVGGTGKTPMSELIMSYMSSHYKIALLSRGYGRKTKGYRIVESTSNYHEVGDEPLQIKIKYPDTLVVVCEKRVEAIERIESEHPEIDLIIMDDGFQHRHVKPKINVIMVDSTRPIPTDKMLPAGQLRDLPSELYRANYFIVTKCSDTMTPLDRRLIRKDLIQFAYQQAFFTRYEYFAPQPIFADVALPFKESKQSVIALSGIGNPLPFISQLKSQYDVVQEITYPDHHAYKVSDMKSILAVVNENPESIIITTEKDAVKLTNRSKIPTEIQSRLYYLPINISFIEGPAMDFLQKLKYDVRGN